MWQLSKFARRLAGYFGALLLLFAFIVGLAFYFQFKSLTLSLRRQEMEEMAHRMAEVVADNMGIMEFYHGHAIANARMLSYLDNVAQEDVWLVDLGRNLYMNPRYVRQVTEGKEVFASRRDAYAHLPAHIRQKIEKGFEGIKFMLLEPSQRFGEVAFTCGVPVVDRHGLVRAVVVLQGPVTGTVKALDKGLQILVFSLLVALGCGLLIVGSVAKYLTRPVARMRSIAEELGKENYQARCNIVQGDEIGELATTMDLMAERLEAAKDQRQRLEKMRRQFIANITHELRTPLTVILANLEALQMGVISEPQEVAETYAQMQKEGLFAKDMITDLLELAKLQNQDFPLEHEDLNLAAVLQDAVQAAGKLAGRKNISVTGDYDREELPFRGDGRRLRQMLMVFLTNAIKFSEAGGSIEVNLRQGEISIRDHGCGMNAEAAEHAFDVFYKSRDERNKEGSGLGLAIARSIADRHGLALTLTSREGVGTRVSIAVPVGDGHSGKE